MNRYLLKKKKKKPSGIDTCAGGTSLLYKTIVGLYLQLTQVEVTSAVNAFLPVYTS